MELQRARNGHAHIHAGDRRLVHLRGVGDTSPLPFLVDWRWWNLKVWWRGRNPDLWGNAKGYNVHNQNMLEACTRLGLEFSEDPDSADVCFQIAVPPSFEPVPGKPNILFTMYEMDTIPHSWIAPIQQADMIIVPCRHNVALFKRHFDGPVEVCQEGIDPNKFKYIERHFPGPDELFTFLWLGATNPRKGHELVEIAWDMWTKIAPPNVVNHTRLYLKTQRSDSEGSKEEMIFPINGMKSLLPRFGARVVFDNRRVSDEEMMRIYSDAHAFILPSFGEGWGLTLCEAQATGAPCIYTPWSGPQDFMKPTFGYPLEYTLEEQKSIAVNKETGKRYTEHVGKAAMADVGSIVNHMAAIYQNYDTALRKGRMGSSYMHRKFTWDIAGQRLIDIFNKRYGGGEHGN